MLEVVLAGVMLLVLVAYVLTGGADFGGGVWDLLARGPRAEAQRDTIAHAIAPIWEANHVWLIIVIVLFFTGFPHAFAAIMTALHVPLVVMLVGIVLRGSAFTFRAYDPATGSRRRMGLVFAISSVVTPIMLGVVLGALSTGDIRVDAAGRVLTGFVAGWLTPFPFAVGFFTLALCAFLAATYLTLEAGDPAVREDFRRRALGSAVAVGVTALAAFLVAGPGAPRIAGGLTASAWAWPLHIVTGLAALAAIAALWTRRFLLARTCAMAQVSLIVVGWGFAQYPYLVVPDLTIVGSAAPQSVLKPVLIALGVGALVLGPALAWLYSVFKGRRAP